MNNFLKQSTAVTKKMGPFKDATDGKTAETGLTIAQADIRLSKNGGAFAQTNNATGATHDEAGYYGVPLDATDVGTLGSLLVSIDVAGALAVWKEFMVVPANVYDAMVLGTDYLQADAVQIEGADATDTINAQCDTAISDVGLTSTITGRIDAAISTRATVTAIWDALTSTLTTASSIGKLIVDNLNAAITSRAATGAKMDLVDAPNATAVAAFTAGFWAALTSGMTTAGSIGKKMADWVVGTIDTYTGNTKQTGDAFARLGAPAGASVSADVAAVKSDTAATLADTNELQTNQGDWLTATGFSTFDPDTDVVARVTLVDTCSVNTDMVDAPDNASITAIKAKTDIIPADLVATLDAILEDTGTTLEAKLVAIKAAVYDSATVSGSVITLSDGATQTLSVGGRTTA